MFSQQVTRLSDSIVVLNLAKIQGGRNAVIARVPDSPGVYAWFRNLTHAGSDISSSDRFADALIDLIESKHCLDRRGRIKPMYEVVLRSKKSLSETKKDALREYSRQSDFRDQLMEILQYALLFQQPLYVGKASDLAVRVNDHLAPSSSLRNRLSQAGIEIDTCWLMYVTLRDESTEGLPSRELVIEDLLSRLFHPLFVHRYG